MLKSLDLLLNGLISSDYSYNLQESCNFEYQRSLIIQITIHKSEDYIESTSICPNLFW